MDRKPIRWNSVRTRLTLWNVGVLGLVLAGFAGALLVAVGAWLQRSTDHELEARMRPVVEGWLRGGPIPGMGQPQMPPGPGDGPFPPGPDGASSGERARPAQGRVTPVLFQAEPRPGAFPGPYFPGPAAAENGRPDPNADFRRPRLFSPQGDPMGPLAGTTPIDGRALQSALAGHPVFSTVEVDGQPVRVFTVPLSRGMGVEGAAQIGSPLGEQRRLYGGLVATLCTLVPLALLVAGGGAAFLTGRALQPVRSVTQAAAELGAEDLSRRLKVEGDDEFAELSVTFNGMVGRLEEAFRRLEEAYEQQRRFTGDASHELRTPLTALKANTSLALSAPRAAAEYRTALEAADRAADTMIRIVQDLLLLARSDAGRLQLQARPVELKPVLQSAAAALPAGVRPPVSLQIAEDVQVSGDGRQLQRLFLNLLENAVRHTPPEGEVRVEAALEEGVTRVRVVDNGEGIAQEQLPHVCERFYRVDAARAHEGYRTGSGTGLGLAICRSIVEAHGGTLTLESTIEEGTVVTVELPAADSSVPA